MLTVLRKEGAGQIKWVLHSFPFIASSWLLTVLCFLIHLLQERFKEVFDVKTPRKKPRWTNWRKFEVRTARIASTGLWYLSLNRHSSFFRLVSLKAMAVANAHARVFSGLETPRNSWGQELYVIIAINSNRGFEKNCAGSAFVGT